MKLPLATTALLCAAGTAAAQTSRWERQVHDQLQRTVTTLGTTGSGETTATKTGVLNAEETEWFAITLSAGVTYAILGVCDNDCFKLQLVLTTPDRNELAIDRRGENFPVLRFTSNDTRVFRVKIVMEGCRVSPCWYGVAVTKGTSGGIERE